jgi:3-phenylpropionate/trans-cinnamate dioxygenase ferredoxin reductase subunit
VRLRGGEVLVTDVVIVGIGIVPSVSALLDASAVVSDGVDVDAACRTSLPDVWAVGDCARQVNRHVGDAAVRIESVQNAVDQAKAAVADILCLPAPEQAVPWFWSNQYDLRLQTAGIAAGADLQIVRGDVATRRFSVVYLRDGRVVALDCVNSTKDFVAARRLIESRAKLPSERLADVAIPLISLLQ